MSDAISIEMLRTIRADVQLPTEPQVIAAREAFLGNLRVEAAKLGANGVLFQGMETSYGGSNVGVGVGGSNYGSSSSYGGGVGFSISPTQKHAHAMAIYVTDPTLPPPPQPLPPAH